jgi:hypothetical protein
MSVSAAPEEVVPITTLHAGFVEARRRFEEAAKEREALAVFLPLFETLNWGVALDDRLQARWRDAPTNSDPWWSDGFTFGDTVKGLRFARHRVHHQRADALWLSEGASGPVGRRSDGLHEWRWRPELPPGRDDRFKTEYEDKVMAVPARVTLHELAECVGTALVYLGQS